MIEPREIQFEPDAVLAMSQILGIMLDQLWDTQNQTGQNSERIIDLDARLMECLESGRVVLGIDDASLLLQGMAFTEVMSADLPWIETVRWVTDFVTVQLRQHWSEHEWQTHSG